MQKDKAILLIKRIYGVAISVAAILLGFALILQVLSIYLEGTAPDYQGDIFTREKVVQKLTETAVYIVIFIVLALFGIVFHVIYPTKTSSPRLDEGYIADRFKRRIPKQAEKNFPSDYATVSKAYGLMNIVKIALISLTVATLTFMVIYMFIPGNMPGKNPTAEIIRLVAIIFPVLAIIALLTIGWSLQEKKLSASLIFTVKKLAAKNQTIVEKQCLIDRIFENKHVLTALRITVAVVGCAFIVIGIANGGARDVFIKAVNICTECIGLG